MAYTRTWDAAYEAYPAATDLVSEGDDRIRNFKTDTRERFAKDHYFDIAGTDADHGEHSKVTLRTGAAPTQAADKGILYAKDVSAKAELFYRDEDGDEVQLTSGGKILVENTIKVVTFTRVMNIADGDQTVTGVGFTPKYIAILGCVEMQQAPVCIGVGDTSNMYCFSSYKNVVTEAPAALWDSSITVVTDINDAAYTSAIIKSLDSDGFTLTFTKTGSPSAEPCVFVAICFK
jgi:hypothetical protein